MSDSDWSDEDLEVEPADPELRALFAACLEGKADEARHLLAASPLLATAADERGRTALHMVACDLTKMYYTQLADTVQVLLRAGAQPLQRDRAGRTPLLHVACDAAFAGAAATLDGAALRLLLQAAPAAALLPEDSGRLPLHWAAARAHPALTRLLLRAAPAAALRADKQGRYPISLALGHLGYGLHSMEDQCAPLESARCLMQAGDAAFLLTALGQQPHKRWHPLYADLAARVPLTPVQWLRVPKRCPGLLRALPAALARGEAEAAALVRRLGWAEQEQLQRHLTAAAAALARPVACSGIPLPTDVRRRLLLAWLALECADW